MSYANKNPQPGDIKYKDMNGDGVIDEQDKTNCGNNVPKVTWGLTNNFPIKVSNYLFSWMAFLNVI